MAMIFIRTAPAVQNVSLVAPELIREISFAASRTSVASPHPLISVDDVDRASRLRFGDEHG
jgi:hypothetical protein